MQPGSRKVTPAAFIMYDEPQLMAGLAMSKDVDMDRIYRHIRNKAIREPITYVLR